MNILFLTILRINSISERGVYPDLVRKFCSEGHKVYIVTPSERRYKQKASYIQEGNATILQVNTLNFQKAGILEKWLATMLVNRQFSKRIKRNLSQRKFDLIIYSTPPITFTRLITRLKKKHRAVTYLLLKDIFPQNAVDLGLMKKGGILHKYFLKKEKDLL